MRWKYGPIVRIETSGREWNYDEAHVLGRGTFGVVYGGTDEAGRDIAVKVIELGSDVRAISHRRREVKLATALGADPGPGVMRYLAVLENGLQCLLVMPRAVSNLEAAKGGWDKAAAIEVLRDVLTGLQTLESLAVVHRDLKPANVLKLDGSWVLSDFGLSRFSSSATSANTLARFGTEAYMAPELWLGEVPTSRSDLYAVGCMAFEMATGSPFFGASDPHRGHLNVAVPPIGGEFSGTYERLVRRLLAKHPQARPASASASLSWLDDSQDETVDTVLDLIASHHDEERAAIDARERRQAEEIALEEAARDVLHEVVDRTVAALRRLDPVAEVRESYGEAGSRQLRALGQEIDIKVETIGTRYGVDRARTVLAAHVHQAKTNSSLASLLCTVSEGALQWTVWQFRSSRTGALEGARFGLSLEALLRAAQGRLPEHVETAKAHPMTISTLLEFFAYRDAGWK